ncbi:hypothetical protein pb186bvf_020706 [Paramecium bursaria]
METESQQRNHIFALYSVEKVTYERLSTIQLLLLNHRFLLQLHFAIIIFLFPVIFQSSLFDSNQRKS